HAPGALPRRPDGAHGRPRRLPRRLHDVLVLRIADLHAFARRRVRLRRRQRRRLEPAGAAVGVGRLRARETFGRCLMIPEDGYLLRVFVGESDRHGHRPLYEVIVLKAREAGLAGATVLRGVMGFGRHSLIHTTKILRLSEDLPMVVEIVDSREKIEGFLPALAE